jgi:hypothetical protein
VKTYSIKGVSIQCCSNPCSITTVPGEDLSSKTGDEAGVGEDYIVFQESCLTQRSQHYCFSIALSEDFSAQEDCAILLECWTLLKEYCSTLYV